MDEAFAWADELAAPVPSAPDGGFVVWPENWDTLSLFWSVRRCWRHHPFGGVMGFDWQQVHIKMAARGLSRRRVKSEDARLELVEAAVLGVQR